MSSKRSSEYYGWLDTTKDPPHLTFIHTSPTLVMMCFGSWYALQYQVTNNKGKLVKLHLTIEGTVDVEAVRTDKRGEQHA